MFFSVIVPNYNHAKFLEQRIQTILNQTYQHFELIVLDDHSTDDSRVIIEKFKHHSRVSHVILNKENTGSPFKQWAKGIEIASGDWIWIAESDDFADEKFLQYAYEAINNYPSIGLYYSDAFIVDENSNLSSKFSSKKNKYFHTTKWNEHYSENGVNEINQHLKWLCSVNNASSAVFKKSNVSSFINQLDNYTYHGDWFFYLNLCLAADIYYCNNALTYCRIHEKSLLGSVSFSVQKKAEHFRILQLLYNHPFITEKSKLVTHFCKYFLGFGLLKNGMKQVSGVLKEYYRINPTLSIKVLMQIIGTRMKKKQYPQWND